MCTRYYRYSLSIYCFFVVLLLPILYKYCCAAVVVAAATHSKQLGATASSILFCSRLLNELSI